MLTGLFYKELPGPSIGFLMAGDGDGDGDGWG
jgi:hypothetical protein